jgi:hypothetical protein
VVCTTAGGSRTLVVGRGQFAAVAGVPEFVVGWEFAGATRGLENQLTSVIGSGHQSVATSH